MDNKHSNNANSWVLIAIIILLLAITIFVGTFFKSENKLQVLLKNNQTVSCFFAVHNDDYKIIKAFVLFYNSMTDRVAGVHLLPNTYSTFVKGGKQDFYILSETYAAGISKEEIKNGISKLLGTPINYYLFISKDNLIKYVDLVGGIEIFTEEISIPAKHIYYPSGIVNLDGDKAIEYLTVKRNNENEYEELKRDEIFIRSVITLKETFQELFNEKIISEYIYPLWSTSLSLNDILVFYNQINTRFLQGISNYSRNFISIIVYCDKDIKNNKSIYLPKKSGFWIKKEIKETLTALEIKEVKEIGNKITVQILNGTDIVGFAGRCKRYLESYGFDVIETGNADHSEYKNTVIIIRNNEAKALKLADLIKCKRTIYENRTQDENNANSKIDVKLILGRDFDGKVVK